MEKAARFISRHPKPILIISVVLLVPCVFGYIGTPVEYDVTSYLPEELNSVKGKAVLDEAFTGASAAFLTIEGASRKEILEIKEKVSATEGVKNVIWTDAFADPSVPPSFLPDVLKEAFYSPDLNSTLTVIQFEENASSESAANAVKKIKSLVDGRGFLSGAAVVTREIKELADRETPVYVAVAVVLALIALSATMSSTTLAFAALLAPGFAVVYNMGTNFFGSVSYITRGVAAVLQLGVTMDYSVFLINRYEEELLKTGDRSEAMARAITKTSVSLTAGSLTTVFGFLALCFMSLTLGLDIGLVMAKGVVLGVLCAVITLPAIILTLGGRASRFRRRPAIPNFKPLAEFSVRRGKTLAAVFFALIIPSFYFMKKTNVYYDVQKALPRDTNGAAALEKLKKNFNMASTHFIITDADVPARGISSMIREFKNTDGISGAASLNSLVGPAVPEDMIPDEIRNIFQTGGYRLTALNSVYEPGTRESEAQLKKLYGILRKYDGNGYITGEAALSDDLAKVTARDLKKTGLISVLSIFILIAFFFKSFGIPALLVTSIELAIMINEAVSFFTGAEIPFVAPTIIGCVQLGATVDYAVLTASRLEENLLAGKDRRTAVMEAATASNRSVFQSALVFFCASFGVYLVCGVTLVKSVCALLARGAAISAVVITVFLPALLSACGSFIDKTTLGRKGVKNEI